MNTKTGSKEMIRAINTRLVIQTIMDEGTISRADISKKLGLTKATISNIVQDLVDQNLLREIGTAQVISGRKPVLLEFCYDCAYGIAVDIAGTRLTVLSSTLGGTHCEVKQYPTANNRDSLLLELIQAIRRQQELIPDCPYGLIGISLGIHGIVDNGEITFSPYSDYSHLELKTTLEKEFQIPVYLENEANLSILGEYTFHFPGKNVVGISVHSGIGLGMIIHKKLFEGTHGYAGEFGHTIIEVDGRPCPCGNSGCLEQYASEKALLAEFTKRKGLSHVTPDEFAVYYQRKDPIALDIMNLFIKYMAVAINNILNTVDPDVIILNSSFTMNFPQLIDQIRDSVTGRNHAFCNLVSSELQDMSILLGGVCLARNNFLKL